MAGWNTGNINGLDAGVAANFQRRSPGGLNSDGLAAFKKTLTDFRASYPDTKVVLDDSHFMKDTSFHLWTCTGTNTGPGAMPPAGKSVKLSGATRLRYQDGKIVEELVYFDAGDWQKQLGFTSTPPTPAGTKPASKQFRLPWRTRRGRMCREFG
ncbi:MAG: ester cyclase [Gemmatimonadales bacterium]